MTSTGALNLRQTSPICQATARQPGVLRHDWIHAAALPGTVGAPICKSGLSMTASLKKPFRPHLGRAVATSMVVVVVVVDVTVEVGGRMVYYHYYYYYLVQRRIDDLVCGVYMVL